MRVYAYADAKGPIVRVAVSKPISDDLGIALASAMQKILGAAGAAFSWSNDKMSFVMTPTDTKTSQAKLNDCVLEVAKRLGVKKDDITRCDNYSLK